MDDLSEFLNAWPFDGGKVNTRLVRGSDGRMKVQLRLDLGVMQMELDGRPDGQRPQDFDSWYDYFQHQEILHGASPIAQEDEYRLTLEDCVKLHQEAVQYYHRYLSLFQLEDWDRVIRDTERNLQVFDFVGQYAEDDDLSWMLEQFTPHVLMMNTRARAMILMQENKSAEAIAAVRSGLKRVEEFVSDVDGDEEIDASPEVRFLRTWLSELTAKQPLSQREKLERDLNTAIEREEYERAAELRDKIQALSANAAEKA